MFGCWAWSQAVTIPVRAWVNQTTIAGLSVRSPMVQVGETVLVASVTGTHRPLREPSDLGPALSTRLAVYCSIVTIEIASVPATTCRNVSELIQNLRDP